MMGRMMEKDDGKDDGEGWWEGWQRMMTGRMMEKDDGKDDGKEDGKDDRNLACFALAAHSVERPRFQGSSITCGPVDAVSGCPESASPNPDPPAWPCGPDPRSETSAFQSPPGSATRPVPSANRQASRDQRAGGLAAGTPPRPPQAGPQARAAGAPRSRNARTPTTGRYSRQGLPAAHPEPASTRRELGGPRARAAPPARKALWATRPEALRPAAWRELWSSCGDDAGAAGSCGRGGCGRSGRAGELHPRKGRGAAGLLRPAGREGCQQDAGALSAERGPDRNSRRAIAARGPDL
ncbi:hypothetical protein H8959_017845 [Pygathrix nigripes]